MQDLFRCSARTLWLWCVGSVAVVRGLQSALASVVGLAGFVLQGTWDLPKPEIKPVSPVLAGGFLTTGPPGKFLISFKDARRLKVKGWKKILHAHGNQK